MLRDQTKNSLSSLRPHAVTSLGTCKTAARCAGSVASSSLETVLPRAVVHVRQALDLGTRSDNYIEHLVNVLQRPRDASNALLLDMESIDRGQGNEQCYGQTPSGAATRTEPSTANIWYGTLSYDVGR